MHLHVNVSFQPELGYVSAANYHVPRSLTALSIEGLRKRIVVAVLSRPGRREQPVSVHLALDDSAQAEVERRRR